MDTSIKDNGIGAVIVGVHYNAGKGILIAPILKLTAYENGGVENSIVVNFQFKF
jgi:hypothetical protein